MSQLPKTEIDQLKDFTKLLISRPETIHDSGLSFFRDYLTSLGATIPDEAPVTKSSGKVYEETIYPNQDTKNEHDLEGTYAGKIVLHLLPYYYLPPIWITWTTFSKFKIWKSV